MENSYALGIWSLLPLVITIIIAYSTKSAVFALITGYFSGVILMGFEPIYGFNNLAQDTCVIFPFSVWGAYIAGLTAGQGDQVDTTGAITFLLYLFI